uniref:Uncharacterized protein n=1 Tax=Globisporangium ultimum (strain ATCC 200006 / CBS 805.95 / DAOM BR144) TaxID=431595 RepID=K3X839_GLOUD
MGEATKPTSEGDAIDVVFSVRVLTRQVPHDAAVAVFVVGDAPELGAWNVDQAVPMDCVKRDDDESEWSIPVTFAVDQDRPVEYKYVVKQTAANEVLSWEAIPGNRTTTITRGGSNVALKQPSSQSSTHSSSRNPSPGPREANFGNNGNTNGYQEWRCARTEKEENPWWEVDLGQEYPLSSIHLWKALTYHEHAKHPEGKPPATSTASTSAVSPPLWLFVSKESLSTENDSLAQAKANASAHQIPLDPNSRVESVHFAPRENNAIVGRYVRLQQESAASVLQFAELQVISSNGASADCNRKLLQKDGIYGVEAALDGDLKEYIDSEWLNPSSSNALLRFWVGSFNDQAPAVQWLPGEGAKHDAVTIRMRYQRLEEGQEGKTTTTWKNMQVDVRSSALLDKQSKELIGELESFKQREVDLKSYLNNHHDPKETDPVASESFPWLYHLEWMQELNPEMAERLLKKVEAKTFAKGESIIPYGVHTRTMFFLRDGEVELFGPDTSIGAKSIGKLSKNALFNELSLFGRWPEQHADFRALETVTCEFVTYKSLLETMHEDSFCSIRDYFIRTAQPVSAEPTLDRYEEDVTHFTDATHAQVFRTQVPLSALSTAAGTANPSALAHRLEFDIYKYSAKTMQANKKLGTVQLLPSQLSAHGEGYLTLPIVSVNTATPCIVGQLTLTYLIIKPFVHARNNLSHVWRSYWRSRKPLNGGHRGMGRSYHQVEGFRHALTRENTLASFILAGRSGADFVEFDVQLTKDKVPVLYHDFVLNVGLEDKNAWTHGSRAEEFEIGIHEMTLRQLQRSYTTPAKTHKSGDKLQVLQKRVRKHWAQMIGDKKVTKTSAALSAASEVAAILEADEDHLVEFFPKLEDLLKHVPAEVGLNVEIKYPDNVWRTAMRHSAPFMMNEYVDAILRCVFDHAGGRRIFFSCFDPNLCVLLRAKQATYPVFFLTYGSIKPNAFDARLTLQFAVNFVKMEQLGGMVSNSDDFIATPELAQVVKRVTKHAVLLTWGDQNTSHMCVQLQKQHAIDGVISDNIGDIMRQDSKLRLQPQHE